eukprot:5207126-Pyramimonas_sp.AAC.1
MQNRATWAGARGPAATVWATLSRAGWATASPTVLVSDQGTHIDMLRFCPCEVRRLLEEIRRWQ